MFRSTLLYTAALTAALSLAGPALSQEPHTEGMREQVKPPGKAALKRAGGASVTILTPKPGQIFKSDQVPVRVKLVKGKRGHHVAAYVDGKLSAGFEGEKGTLIGIEPGKHVLEVRVVAAGHQTDLGAVAKVNFEVKGTGDKKDDAKVAPLAAQGRKDTGPAVTGAAKAREVEKAVRAVFAAFNNRDADAFLAGWTDAGFRETFGQPKEAAKRSFPRLRAFSVLEPFAVGKFSHTVVGEDTATTEVELTQSNLKKTHWLSLVKKDKTWKIDSDKEIATKIPSDVTVIPVTMTESGFEFDSSAVTRNVAFQVFNATGQMHDFSVFILPADSGAETLLGGPGSLEPGEAKTVLLADLAPGRYAILCNRLATDGQPYSAKGMRAEFTVPSAALPPDSQPSEGQTAQPEGESDKIALPQ